MWCSCPRLAVLLALATSTDEKPPEWIQYESTAGGYKVSFPQRPVEQTQQQGVATLYLAVADSKLPGGLRFLSQYTDISNTVRTKDDEDRFFVGQKKAYARSGKVISEQECSLAQARGREFIIEMPDGTTILSRSCVANGRGYNLIVLAPDQQALRSPEVASFFASFSINNYKATVYSTWWERLDTEEVGSAVGVSVTALVLILAIFFVIRRKTAKAKESPQA
jgi:hypothetical protein